ncbi:MAG: GrpB family protein [Flavobacteriales bacterium]|nr:GrpB family protein [Flavobacteriales bacterium]MCC6937968.1 GrpB family protein [Flavobacteriales bacterium]
MDTVPHHRIEELRSERIAIVPHDPSWSERYSELEAKLSRSLPDDLIQRIAHIGSTAVPGLSAKPIIDVQVEVSSLDRVRREVVPIMRDLAFEYIWRPTMGEAAPFYAWFIGRNTKGERTSHIHMVEPDAASADRILFRDFLRINVEEIARYEDLKHRLSSAHPNDRAAYTLGKTGFVMDVLRRAKLQRS